MVKYTFGLALLCGFAYGAANETLTGEKGLPVENEPSQIHLECEELLAGFTKLIESGNLNFSTTNVDRTSLNEDLAVLAERHQLTELFAADDAHNLAMQRPFIAMSAPQRLIALIQSQGATRMYLPGKSHRKVTHYPLFSDGLDIVGNVRVVGQYAAISSFVESVRSQALGDRSGNSPTLLEGPHGTGKSEFLRIIRSAYIGLTSAPQSSLGTYTYELINLHKIPALRPYLNISKLPDGTEASPPRRAPMNHSPVALLPAPLQEEIYARVKNRVAELTDGLVPIAPMETDPQSKFIVDQILLHFRSLIGGRELTNLESLAILNQFVSVRRVVFGKQAGTLPTIEFQGNDIDNRGLFMAPDPMNALTSGDGYGHPMSWHLNGKVLLGNDNVILMDEVLRNSEEFLNFLLAVIESHVVDLGGSPRVPFNAVMLAATNEANTNVAKRDPKAAAQLDRFRKVSMRWPVAPHEVAETMLYMKQVGLLAKPLSQSDGFQSDVDIVDTLNPHHTKITLRELFPLPEPSRPVLGPDGRYRLWYREGNHHIDISPHALMFLSEVVGATRVKTGIEGYEELLAPYKIVNDPLFRSETTRILMHEGVHRVTMALGKELDEVTTKLKEGNTGISSRDAGRWLTEVLSEARTEDHHNTVTIDLVMSVFKRLLDEEAISAPSLTERARWLTLARKVATDIVLGRLNSDIHQAVASNSNNLDSAYDEVFEELKALDEDPAATEITTSGSVKGKSIKKERLEKVRAIFHRLDGRPLLPGKILTAMHSTAVPGRALPKHPSLVQAIREYYAAIESDRVNIDAIYESAMTGEGNDERKAATSDFFAGMERLGYSRYAALQALETAKQWKDDLEPKP